MLNDELKTFTDRHEAIALFQYLRGREPKKPWPLLPILTFIAPGGSGKSALMEYLRVKKCCLPDGRAAVPYAHLDFTLAGTPKDLLSILTNLRDQLQQQDDGQGKHLTFPRFDLGALIALAAPTNEDLSTLGPNQVRRRLQAGKQFFEALTALSSALGYTVPYVAPLLAGLKLAGTIAPVQDILLYLENRSGWSWYRMHGVATGLGANASIKDVLLRLHALSMPGKPERDYLLSHLLPAAFIADLFDTLVRSDPPGAWSKTANVVLFLDGFEALLGSSDTSSTAIRLLEVLTLTEHREGGEADPLLLVVGSRERLLLEFTSIKQEPPFEQHTQMQNEEAIQKRIRELYEEWQQNLPVNRSILGLRDLYLPFWLHDFGWDDTRSYLSRLSETEQKQVFTDKKLIEGIHRVSHGHPLSVALAVAVVLEVLGRGRNLNLAQFVENGFVQASVPRKVDPGHEHEHIGAYLLDLFLRQLPKSEQDELISCAAARTLDAAILRDVLQMPTVNKARERWNRYRNLTFVRALDNERIVFHPIVRELLLQRLPPSRDPESDYQRVHTRLRDHFHKRASTQLSTTSQRKVDWQAQIEESYHALALEDPEPAIVLALSSQRTNLALWEQVLEAVGQAPADLMPPDIMQRASNALNQAKQHHYMQDCVTALVLYRWLLTASNEDIYRAALIQNDLGLAYWSLPGGGRQQNLKQAITCYEIALQVRTRESLPVEWAATQNNLGNAYRDLPGRDRQQNMEKAITCYEAALQVRTHESLPVEWAATQTDLGLAYWSLPRGDRQQNMEKAITCYEAALQVRTHESLPVEWAATQNNLGLAYIDLPEGDRQENIEKAITCYEAALQVRTRESFPLNWAQTQNNLGIAYWSLPEGDRQENIEKAITCYQEALQVYTRESFPLNWAQTQNNLGTAYWSLPEGDRQENMEKAVSCYEASLQVYTRESFPVEWAAMQTNLGIAYSNLPRGDRQQNIEKAIACYEAALQVRTRESFPVEWAATQNNLGTAYWGLPGGDRQQNTEKAIACYEDALQVYERASFPVEWARTQNNLGNAHRDLPEGDRQQNIEKAIACYEAALQVRTRESLPVEWAKTQNNLGNAYRDLPGGDHQQNIRKAIACYEAALQVYTYDTFPTEWAEIHYNLGTAYYTLPEGDRQQNIEKAIAYYDTALQVYQSMHIEDDTLKVREDIEVAKDELQRLRQG